MKNIKKFICLLIVTVLITPSIAIAEDTYSGYFNNEEITMFADTSVKISENEKSAVEDIISDLNNLKTESDIQKYNIPLGNIQELIDSLPKAIQYEHPELFYVNLRQFSYKTADGQTISEIMIKDPFTMEKDEIKEAQKLIDAECTEIVSSVPKDATELEKVLFVHDYITSHYEYDMSYQNRNLYTAVRDKKCVCQGYSYLFMYIMNKYFEIECTTVPSDACNHIWNKVKVDGKWYNLDLTSDDPTPNLSSLANHTYFLLSDEELKAVSASSVSNSNGGLYVEEQDIHRTWNVNTWYGEPVITAEDDTYKDSIIHNVSGPVSFIDEKIYCFNDKNELSALDLSTNTFTPVYKDTSKYYWCVYGDNKSAYSSHFNVTVAYSGKLYFNSPNKVFEFDTKTNTAKEIYEYTEIPDISKTYLFGLTVKDGNLCAEYTTNLMNGVESFITIIAAPKPTETPIVTETPTVTASPVPTESPTVTESPVPTETPTVTEVPKPVIAYESKITPKDDGTYTISVDKKIETTDTPILYVAEFDENNILIGLKAVPYTEPVSVSAHDDSQMLKAFVWNIGSQPISLVSQIVLTKPVASPTPTDVPTVTGTPTATDTPIATVTPVSTDTPTATTPADRR